MFDGSEESCVTQYTNTFTQSGGGCSGQNEICSASSNEAPCTGATTEELCERLCLDIDNCASYEFGADGNVCHLSSTCTGDTADDDNWVYYYRNYASCSFTPEIAGEDPECAAGDARA